MVALARLAASAPHACAPVSGPLAPAGLPLLACLLVAEPVVVEDVPDAPASASPVDGLLVVWDRRRPLVFGAGAPVVVVVVEEDDDEVSGVEVVVVRGLCRRAGLVGAGVGGAAAGG